MRTPLFRYILLFSGLIPLYAKADLVWPSLFIVKQYYSWYILLFGLLVELVFIKIFAKASWGRAASIDLAINAISALIGIILIPASGILVELLLAPFGGGTFQLSHWVCAYLLAIVSNTCIEGLAMKWIFKFQFNKVFWWLLGANALSVILCCFVPF